MDFDLSSDQKMLRDTAEAFAKRESPVTRFRALRDDARGWSKDTLKKMGDLGWLAVMFPEEHGGLGGSFVDLAIVLEALGATLVPEPIIASIVLGGGAISRAGDPGQRERWLHPALAGDTSLAFAYAERESRFDPLAVKTLAEKSGKGFALTGEKVFVLNGHAADHFVASARAGSAVELFVVDPRAKGVTVRPIATMDGQHAAMITFDHAEAEKLSGDGQKTIEDVLDLGAAAACAEGVGNLKTCLGMTRDYLCTREQFGVKIGTFQALQHRAVDMFIELELTRSASILASLAVDFPDVTERRAAISAAKAQLAQSGRFVTQQAVQLHGGIGITDEHDIGLYFKRMLVLNTLFGDEEHHVARYAALPSFATV